MPRTDRSRIRRYATFWSCAALMAGAALAGAAGTPSAVREVRVGVYENEPKILTDENGDASGILGELLTEIALREQWALQPVACEWSRCLALLEAGEIDLLPDVAWSEQRDQVMDFHKVPSLYSWSALYRHPDIRMDSVLDLQGLRVAVLGGSIQQGYLQSMLESFNIEAEWVPVQSLRDGFARVAGGDADAVVASRHFGEFVVSDYGLRVTPVIFQPVRLYYATAEGRNGELLAAVDNYLQGWTRDPGSVYFRILERWGDRQPLIVLPSWVRWGLASLSLMLMFTLAGVALLRWQVREKSRRLVSSEQKHSAILNSVEAAIFIKDSDLRYRYGNRHLSTLFGRPLDEIIGRSDFDFFPSDKAQALRSADLQVLHKGERVVSELHLAGSDDAAVRTFLSSRIPLRDDAGNVTSLCGIATDITAHKQNLEEIHQLAFYDPLTGLPNRRLLLDRLEHALATRSRHHQDGALLFIDLDNFKNLNDTLGHDMGDLLLRQVALRLREQTREIDTLARLGGDEFVLMAEGLASKPGEAMHQAELVAEKVIGLLAEPYLLPGREYSGGASIGVTLFSDGDDTVEELLKRADLAMYKAKSAGRNRVRFFNPQMQAEVTARANLEADMRRGLRERQFYVEFQPLVDASGSVTGAEVLVRWRHPQKGVISPADFIPVAEATGLILPLGRWILESACQQLVAWSRDPRLGQLKLAVNISASQFHHPEFVRDVIEVLADTGADPRLLELELTESQLIEDVEAMIVNMNRLREQGVRFSLDDFGTGYSSLSYLKRLPLNHLKIDQSFVRDLLVDPNDAAIVRTVIALGRSLDLEVVAEGVENDAQWQSLQTLGCDLYQGYLFSRPVAVEVLQQLCRQRESD